MFFESMVGFARDRARVGFSNRSEDIKKGEHPKRTKKKHRTCKTNIQNKKNTHTKQSTQNVQQQFYTLSRGAQWFEPTEKRIRDGEPACWIIYLALQPFVRFSGNTCTARSPLAPGASAESFATSHRKPAPDPKMRKKKKTIIYTRPKTRNGTPINALHASRNKRKATNLLFFSTRRKTGNCTSVEFLHSSKNGKRGTYQFFPRAE